MKLWETPRTWIGLGVAAALAVVAAGWLLLVGPQFSQAASIRESAEDALTQNSALSSKIAALKTKEQQKDEQRVLLRRLVTALPAAPDYDSFSVALQQAATKSKVGVSTLTVGGVTAVTASGATTSGTTGSSAAAATATPEATAAATATPAATATAESAASSLKAVRVDWTVTTTGTLAQQRAFLTAVRGLDRATVVTDTALTAQAQGGGSTGSLTDGSTMTTGLSVFVAPRTTAEATALEALLTGKTG